MVARSGTAKKTTSRKPGTRKTSSKKPTASSASSESQQIVWSGCLDLTRAVELHAQLRDALAACKSLTVKIDAADSFDLSAVQLLLAAQRSARTAGKTLHLSCDDDVHREIWIEAGLTEEWNQLTAPLPAAPQEATQ